MHNDQIDIQRGLAYLAGKKQIYTKVIGTFIKQKEEKSEELQQFFANEDFDRLTIEFHGLKSSSATLGSTALPPFALEMELAGKEGNDGLIREKFNAFILQYKDTCDALESALIEIDQL